MLLGFSNEQIENAIRNHLETNGYKVTIHSHTSKKTIKEYIMKNKDCNVAILQEKIGREVYKNAEEIAALTDQRDVNIIIVLSDRYKGTDFMVKLYTAGVVNAIFQVGAKGGASVKTICELVMKPRSRKDAREYYNISSKKLELDVIEESDNNLDLYEAFINGSKSTLENYLEVCAGLSISQMAEFTRRLPEDSKEELAQYEEFHTLLAMLKKSGYDLKIKRPKKVFVGLRETVQIEMNVNGIDIKLNDNSKQEEVIQEQGEISEDISNLSMEELLAMAKAEGPISTSYEEGSDVDTDTDEESFSSVQETKTSNETSNEMEVVEDNEKAEREEKKKEIERKKAEELREREERRLEVEEKRKEAEEKIRLEKEERENKKKQAKEAAEEKRRLEKEERARKKEKKAAKKNEEQKARRTENVEEEYSYDEDELILDSGETGGIHISLGFIVGAAILIALICFVGWLSMGNHITIGGYTI